MFHYTNKQGYNGIRSSSAWRFVASKPPGEHPPGAYFTDYGASTPLLAQKLRIPREKLGFYFSFADVGDLRPLRGGRGEHIFYSEADYAVLEPRQISQGSTGL